METGLQAREVAKHETREVEQHHEKLKAEKHERDDGLHTRTHTPSTSWKGVHRRALTAVAKK